MNPIPNIKNNTQAFFSDNIRAKYNRAPNNALGVSENIKKTNTKQLTEKERLLNGGCAWIDQKLQTGSKAPDILSILFSQLDGIHENHRVGSGNTEENFSCIQELVKNTRSGMFAKTLSRGFQKLLAYLFIKLHPELAFPNNRLELCYKSFEGWLMVASGIKGIETHLSTAYYQNILNLGSVENGSKFIKIAMGIRHYRNSFLIEKRDISYETIKKAHANDIEPLLYDYCIKIDYSQNSQDKTVKSLTPAKASSKVLSYISSIAQEIGEADLPQKTLINAIQRVITNVHLNGRYFYKDSSYDSHPKLATLCEQLLREPFLSYIKDATKHENYRGFLNDICKLITDSDNIKAPENNNDSQEEKFATDCIKLLEFGGLKAFNLLKGNQTMISAIIGSNNSQNCQLLRDLINKEQFCYQTLLKNQSFLTLEESKRLIPTLNFEFAGFVFNCIVVKDKVISFKYDPNITFQSDENNQTKVIITNQGGSTFEIGFKNDITSCINDINVPYAKIDGSEFAIKINNKIINPSIIKACRTFEIPVESNISIKTLIEYLSSTKFSPDFNEGATELNISSPEQNYNVLMKNFICNDVNLQSVGYKELLNEINSFTSGIPDKSTYFDTIHNSNPDKVNCLNKLVNTINNKISTSDEYNINEIIQREFLPAIESNMVDHDDIIPLLCHIHHQFSKAETKDIIKGLKRYLFEVLDSIYKNNDNFQLSTLCVKIEEQLNPTDPNLVCLINNKAVYSKTLIINDISLSFYAIPTKDQNEYNVLVDFTQNDSKIEYKSEISELGKLIVKPKATSDEINATGTYKKNIHLNLLMFKIKKDDDEGKNVKVERFLLVNQFDKSRFSHSIQNGFKTGKPLHYITNFKLYDSKVCGENNGMFISREIKFNTAINLGLGMIFEPTGKVKSLSGFDLIAVNFAIKKSAFADSFDDFKDKYVPNEADCLVNIKKKLSSCIELIQNQLEIDDPIMMLTTVLCMSDDKNNVDNPRDILTRNINNWIANNENLTGLEDCLEPIRSGSYNLSTYLSYINNFDSNHARAGLTSLSQLLFSKHFKEIALAQINKNVGKVIYIPDFSCNYKDILNKSPLGLKSLEDEKYQGYMTPHGLMFYIHKNNGETLHIDSQHLNNETKRSKIYNMFKSFLSQNYDSDKNMYKSGDYYITDIKLKNSVFSLNNNDFKLIDMMEYGEFTRTVAPLDNYLGNFKKMIVSDKAEHDYEYSEIDIVNNILKKSDDALKVLRAQQMIEILIYVTNLYGFDFICNEGTGIVKEPIELKYKNSLNLMNQTSILGQKLQQLFDYVKNYVTNDNNDDRSKDIFSRIDSEGLIELFEANISLISLNNTVELKRYVA